MCWNHVPRHAPSGLCSPRQLYLVSSHQEMFRELSLMRASSASLILFAKPWSGPAPLRIWCLSFSSLLHCHSFICILYHAYRHSFHLFWNHWQELPILMPSKMNYITESRVWSLHSWQDSCRESSMGLREKAQLEYGGDEPSVRDWSHVVAVCEHNQWVTTYDY